MLYSTDPEILKRRVWDFETGVFDAKMVVVDDVMLLSFWQVVDAVKLFLDEIEISPKIKNLKIVLSDAWTGTKMWKQNYFNATLRLFIALKMAYFCSCNWGVNLDFLDFLRIVL